MNHLELETDKVIGGSISSGTLTVVNFKDGDTVEVGAVLGEISEGPGIKYKKIIKILRNLKKIW